LECGGKRSATPLWIESQKSKAPPPLRSVGALQKRIRLESFFDRLAVLDHPELT
jgi:hypothetical protein